MSAECIGFWRGDRHCGQSTFSVSCRNVQSDTSVVRRAFVLFTWLFGPLDSSLACKSDFLHAIEVARELSDIVFETVVPACIDCEYSHTSKYGDEDYLEQSVLAEERNQGTEVAVGEGQTMDYSAQPGR